MHPIQAIKDHPWLAGAAAAVVLLYFLYSGSGGSSVTSGAPAATTDPNADALAAAQLQAQTTVAGYDASATHDATVAQSANDLATIQSSTVEFQNQLEAEVALSQIGGQVQENQSNNDVANNANTLSANVAMNNNATQLGIVNSNNATQLAQVQSLTGALVTNATTAANANVAVAGINAQTAQSYIQSAGQVALQNAQNNAPSLWDQIF